MSSEDPAFDSYTRSLNHRLERRSPAISKSQPAMSQSKLGKKLEEAQEIDSSLNKSRRKYAVLAAPAAHELAQLKQITNFAVFVAYSLKLEVAFLEDTRVRIQAGPARTRHSASDFEHKYE